jgi:predicted small metal-binding protein
MEDSLRVRCVCGWETSGTEEDVIAATEDHGLRVHNMRATREEILAMAVSD